MHAVHRFPFYLPLVFDDKESFETRVEMPANARILDVHLQRGEPTIWALVEVDEARGYPIGKCVRRHFRAVPTGQPFEGTAMEYVGTILVRDGGVGVHLFERRAS